MTTSLYVIVGLIVLLVIIPLAYRSTSRHFLLPVPLGFKRFLEMDNPFTKTNQSKTIIMHLDLKEGMKVLDIGCGPGRLTIPISRHVGEQGEVVAMDIKEEMLTRLNDKSRSANLKNVRFLKAGPGEGKMEKGYFDRILLVTVLGEISDRESAMKEIFEALKPGGILSVSEIILDPHFQSRKKIVRLANSVGFQERSFFGNWFDFTLNLVK